MEDDYASGKWEDSIHNSRKYLECVQREVVAAHSKKVHNKQLENRIYSAPKEVRKYLLIENLIDNQEKEVMDKLYVFLSTKGSHPFIAEDEQARFARILSMTLSRLIRGIRAVAKLHWACSREHDSKKTPHGSSLFSSYVTTHD